MFCNSLLSIDDFKSSCHMIYHLKYMALPIFCSKTF